MCSYRATISLGSWRRGGIAHTTRALQWLDTGSLGRTIWDGEERINPVCERALGMHGTDGEPAEGLWVRISGQNNVVGVCYRLHDEEEAANEAFLEQLEKASSLQALVFKEYFNHCNICWRGNTTE